MKICITKRGWPIGKAINNERGPTMLPALLPNPRAKSPDQKKGEQEKNGFNRRTGGRNRCCRRGSENHVLPKCPVRLENKPPAPPSAPPSIPRSSFSSITLEDTPSERKSVERSFTASSKADFPIFYAKNESVDILDSGATANLARLQWLRRHNELLVTPP